MKLRVVLTLSKIKQEGEKRMQYIFDNVDYVHLIQTIRLIPIPFSEMNLTNMMEKEESRIDNSKFSFTSIYI